MLNEISNQETNYDWNKKRSESHNFTSLTKKKKYSYNAPKSYRLPLIMNKKITESPYE